MKVEGKSSRIRERLSLSLTLRVEGRESLHEKWVETTRLTEAAQTGAGFTLARAIERGRLLHLTLPMPRHMRCFDIPDAQYRVWALVRYVRALAPDAAGATRFIYGGAFIGKHPPASYESDPTTLYDLRPTLGRDGMWVAREQPKRGGRYVRQSESRHMLGVRVTIEVFNDEGRVVGREQSETENISQHGAATKTTLQTKQGTFVRLTSEQPPLSVLAVVRGRSAVTANIARLHLEFIDGEWPFERVS